jgi:hypothetical protein
MSNPQTQQSNLKSFKEAMAKKSKLTLSEAEVNQLQRIAEKNPEELKKIPAFAGLQDALSMSEAEATASRLSGVSDRGLNEQYAETYRGNQKLDLGVTMMAQGIVTRAVNKGGSMRGAAGILMRPRTWTNGEVVLAALITMFAVAAIYNLSTSPNFTAALLGGFYGIPNLLIIATILILAFVLMRRRGRRM